MTALSPRHVLITGSNRGIGFEFVKQFLQTPSPPAMLFAGCRKPDKALELKRLASEHKNLRVLQLDVTDDDSIEAARVLVESQVGDAGLNLLLNNAGIDSRANGIDQMTRDGLNRHFDTNTTSQIMMVKAFRPLLKRAASNGSQDSLNCNEAAVINVSSDLSLVNIITNMQDFRYAYCASKCALNMAGAMIANEMFRDKILVVSLSPGWVTSDMGGPDAHYSVPKGVAMCMDTLKGIDGSFNGKLVHLNGEVLSWSESKQTEPCV